jgi:hypothetical protein
LTAAIADDEAAFAALTERHRRELHVSRRAEWPAREPSAQERPLLEDGVIAEITTFGAGLFPEFGLPPTL